MSSVKPHVLFCCVIGCISGCTRLGTRWSAFAVLLVVQQEMLRRVAKQVYSSIGFPKMRLNERCASTLSVENTGYSVHLQWFVAIIFRGKSLVRRPETQSLLWAWSYLCIYKIIYKFNFNGVFRCHTGGKSDDPLSPAYAPRLFSFITPHERTALENSFQRYESVKLRNERRELLQQEERMTNEETISLTTDAHVEYLP